MVARSYAADVSLVNDCLRVNDEQRPFFYNAVHRDIADALIKFKAAGGVPRDPAVRQVRAAPAAYPPEHDLRP